MRILFLYLICHVFNFWIFAGLDSCLYNGSATKRRAERRQRAQARLAWQLHKKGLQPLGPHPFPRFLSKLSSSMKKQTQPPWKCLACKRIVSGTHDFCGKCGQSWQLCADPQFIPPLPQQRTMSPRPNGVTILNGRSLENGKPHNGSSLRGDASHRGHEPKRMQILPSR